MARKFFLFAGILSLLLLGAGCGDDAKESAKPKGGGGGGAGAPAQTKDEMQWKVAQAVIDGNNQIADALQSIKDVETAKVAAPKIQAAVDAIKAASKKMQTFEEPSDAIKKRMDAEFRPALQKAHATITKELTRLGQLPEALKVIKPAIDSMNN